MQTTGNQAGLGIGDYYTHTTGDNTTHLMGIYIPCLPNTDYRIDLFDPEAFEATGQTAVDEIRNTADDTNFFFLAPDSTVLESEIYTPTGGTHETWVEFALIQLPANPVEGVDCGIYYIETWTGNTSGIAAQNNDDNAWMVRVRGGNLPLGVEEFDAALGPDGLAGTGDEVWLGLYRLTYQRSSTGTTPFYWFVDDDGTPNWVGRNFDMDGSGPVIYVSPSGVEHAGTVAGTDAQWNPGQDARGSGDPFNTLLGNTEPGLWTAFVTIGAGNQYIFEVENDTKPYFLQEPEIPLLTIDKDDGRTTVFSPDTTTYTLTITNTGVGAALPIPGYEVIDTLPAGMTATSCTVNAPLVGTCTPAGNLLNIELGPQTVDVEGVPTEIPAFLPGSTSGLQNFGTITVEVSIDDDLVPGTELTNSASVWWTDSYSNLHQPVTATDTDVVVSEADVSITKADDADPLQIGDNIVYTLTVTNNGPQLATGVVVVDIVPANTTFVSATSPCTQAAGVITCELGDMEPDDEIVLTVALTPTGIGLVTNTASVAVDELTEDTDPDNNSDTETTNVIRKQADVAITKVDDADPLQLGDNLVYTLTVTNNGPNTASGVVVTDNVPANTTFISATSPCTQAAGVITCELGDMEPDDEIALTVALSPTGVGIVINTASVAVDELTEDTDPNNNSDTETTQVVTTTDVGITKIDVADPVQLGNNIVYTLTITNNGPALATDVVVTDSVPATTTFVSATSPCTQAAGVITCELGDMEPDDEIALTVTVTSTAPGVVTNTASVAVGEFTVDSNPDNNSDTEPTDVFTLADVVITKTDAVDPVQLGNNIVYTLTVTNNGPQYATDVVVTDSVPATTTFVSATSPCTQAAGVITCELGDMEADEEVILTVTVTPTVPGVVTNTASVAVGEFTVDSNLDNNSDTEPTDVFTLADVAITKTDAVDPVTLYENIVYTLTVTNNGPQFATDVVVTDPVPANATFVSATSPCTFAAGVITCELGDMANGAVETITVTVSPNAIELITNTATVAVGEFTVDSVAENNSATEPTQVIPLADLQVTKEHLSPFVELGETIIYRLRVTNHGPDAAEAVVVTDRLPANTTFVSASSSCTFAAGVITCELGDMAPDERQNLQIVIRPEAGGTVTNTARVTREIGRDPNPGNNVDTEQTTVRVNVPPVEPSGEFFNPVLRKQGFQHGDEITWDVTLINAGAEAGTNITITDALPDGLEVVSVDINKGTTMVNGKTVTVSLPTLRPGESVTAQVVTKVTQSGGSIINKATSTGTGPDGKSLTMDAYGRVDLTVAPSPTPVPPTPQPGEGQIRPPSTGSGGLQPGASMPVLWLTVAVSSLTIGGLGLRIAMNRGS